MTQDVSTTQESADEDNDDLDGRPDQYPSEDLGADDLRKQRHPNSLANLRPPFPPGRSGNPSGLTKDGRPTRSARRILEDRLNSDEQRSLKRLVANWIKHANKGSAKHLELILNRIDPDSLGGDQKVVFEGIRIETRGEARVLVARGELEPASLGERRPSEPGEHIHEEGKTFALTGEQESHVGGHAGEVSDAGHAGHTPDVVTQQEKPAPSVGEGSPPAV